MTVPNEVRPWQLWWPIDLIYGTEQISSVQFVSQVKLLITKHRFFVPGDRILVAVSGGPDSVALLHVLHELRDELGLQIEVAHLQHGIRGQEAKDDARFVGALAGKLGLAFHLKEIALPSCALGLGKAIWRHWRGSSATNFSLRSPSARGSTGSPRRIAKTIKPRLC